MNIIGKPVPRAVRRLSRWIRLFAFEALAPLRTRRYPRRFHAYCVGAAKTGTHSLAGLFARHYRAAHEPEPIWTIDIILAAAAGRLKSDQIERFIRRRDRRLWLELESSNLCYHFIRTLVPIFPDAKFILTIRDCYSWLDSEFNHQLWVNAQLEWQRLLNYRFNGAGLRHAPEERALAERNLYTLDGYLASWSRHNRTVIETVPREKLLIVRTDRIRDDLPRIAAFIGVPLGTLDASQVHAYQRKTHFGLLSQIDQDYLEAKVKSHCFDLMQEYFPDRLTPPVAA